MIETVFDWMYHLYNLLASTTELSPWVYGLIFVGGLVSAMSPCYIPILAMFAGYVGGYAGQCRTAGLELALPFVAGNAVTLALAGGIAALLGGSALRLFSGYELDRWIPGVIGLLMGLQLLGIIKLTLPEMPTVRSTQRPDSIWRSFALGLPFGLVVTPCTIPIFFAIVTFVAFQANVLHGALLMVTYAVGRGIVLMAVAMSTGLLKSLNLGRAARYAERVSGVLVLGISLGLLLFYDAFVRFTMQWMPM